MRFNVVAVALVSLLVAVPAAAVDRVVDDKGVTCLSGRPLHTTISGAVAAAAPGEKILVCAGTYNENVTVNKAGVTLQGQGGPRLRPGNASLPGIDVVADGVTIRGLDVAGFAGDTFTCGVRVDANSADIQSNRVTTNSIGICVFGGSDHRVRYNVAQDNTRGGISVFDVDGPVDVSNNTVKNNTLFGIAASRCLEPGVLIDHNEVTGSRIGLITGEHRNPCRDFVISNNTLRGPGASTPDSIGVSTFEASGVYTRNSVQDFQTGMYLSNCNGCTATFNAVSFSDVGFFLQFSNGTTVNRNNVSRSATVDCRWDTSGVNVLTGNNCGTQDPAGAFD